MKIAVVGSSVLTEKQRQAAVHLIECITFQIKHTLESSTLVSGGAEGIDSLAEEDWDLWGWGKIIHLPKNPRWEPEGYKERNLLVAQDCDVLYCIRARDSQTYGSGWTADRAEEMGKPVWRFYV